jgi:eukaryotic-like serine/threonine-protein kinase
MSGLEIAGYTISRNLAGGGMSCLLLGVDGHQHRVLIRRLKPELAGERRMREAFAHGAAVLGRIHHPNVVRFVRAGMTEDHQLYTVLEYVDGHSMRELILSRSQLLKLNPLSMIRQMAAALRAVHHAGFLHLDFKPENLMVRDDGHVVLVDFDLAHERKPKPFRIHPLPGTFAYLPPETIEHETVCEQTDIYAFGVTCYELLTGHKPFEASNIALEHHKQLDPHAKPRSLSHFGVHIQPQLERVIFKSLARFPGDRYPSMALVQRDIETLV